MDSGIHPAHSFQHRERVLLHLGHQAAEREKLRAGAVSVGQRSSVRLHTAQARWLSDVELGDNIRPDMDNIVSLPRYDAVQFNFLQYPHPNARDVACTKEERHQQRDLEHSRAAGAGLPDPSR